MAQGRLFRHLGWRFYGADGSDLDNLGVAVGGATDHGSLTGLTDEDHPASAITIAKLGTPTVNQTQEYLDVTGSVGWFTGGEITDGGTGTIDVAAGQGFIRATDSDTAPILSFAWSASAGIAVTDDTTQYVYVNYHATTPFISLSTSEFEESNIKILIGVAVDEGGSIVAAFNLGVRLGESIGQAGRFLRRVFGITKDIRRGGLVFGQSSDANKYVTLTAGTLWWGRTEYTITARTPSATFDRYYYDGAAWVKEASQTAWPNGSYNNIASGLVAMTNNRWANLYFYIEPDDQLVMVYGRAEFLSQTLAEAEAVPNTLPPRLQAASVLTARFTFEKSSNTAVIFSAFDTVFSSSGAADHGVLSGLSDDDHPGNAWLVGRAGGQTLKGGTAAGELLTLYGSSNADQGSVYIYGDRNVGVESALYGLNVETGLSSGLNDGGGNIISRGYAYIDTISATDYYGFRAANTYDVSLGKTLTNARDYSIKPTVSGAGVITNLITFDIQEPAFYMTPVNTWGLRIANQGTAGVNVTKAFEIEAQTGSTTLYNIYSAGSGLNYFNGVIQSAVATGTAPFTVASTTKVANLNVDSLDDQSGAYYLDSANFTGANWTDLTDGGATTLHSHAGGSAHTIREQGVDQTARTGLNFIDADAGVGLITDDAGGDETEVNLDLYLLAAAATSRAAFASNWTDLTDGGATTLHSHAGGAGDVVGPASAVDGNLAVFDGVTGKLIKDGGAVPGAGAASMGRTFAFMGA